MGRFAPDSVARAAAVPVTELPVADWDRFMAVNLRGPFICTKATAFAAGAEREARSVGARALQSHLRAGDLAGTLVFLASAVSDAMSGQTVVTGMGGFNCQRQR